MTKNKKFIGKLFLSIIAIFIFVSLVNALGLSQDYHDGNPLKVGPGESKEVMFGRFQNPDNTDVTLKLELVEGGDIAELTGNNLGNFVIPAGNLATPLNIKVSIPEEVPEGTKYNVVVKYADITSKGGTGMITMTQAFTSSMPILVEKPKPAEIEKPSAGSLMMWSIIIIVLIIIIAVVVYFLMRKPRKKSR